MKKSIKIIALILVILLILLIVVVILMHPKTEPHTEPEQYPYANWMTDRILPSTLLTELVIPGAHDAGAADLDGTIISITRYLLVCQNATILEQLKCGVRYFDLRTKTDDGVLYIQHGDLATQKFSTVVEHIASYLAEYKDFFILNLQHFTDDAAAEATYSYLVQNIPNFEDLALPSDTELSTLTLGDVQAQGKRFMIIWGRDSAVPNDAILYRKSDNNTLYSPYDGDIHSSSDEELITQFSTYIDTSKQYSGFFNLQCQRTWSSKDPFRGPEQLEEIFAPKADAYISGISDEVLPYINIIHRDFVTNDDKIRTILQLNNRKGFVKDNLAF